MLDLRDAIREARGFAPTAIGARVYLASLLSALICVILTLIYCLSDPFRTDLGGDVFMVIAGVGWGLWGYGVLNFLFHFGDPKLRTRRLMLAFVIQLIIIAIVALVDWHEGRL